MLITISMTTGQDSLRPLPPELEPLLSLQLPEGWIRMLLSDGKEIYGVGFWYGEGARDSVSIRYWDGSHRPRFLTGLFGSSDRRYEDLKEAIERVQYLMPIVARGVHWAEIAAVRNAESRMRLIDLDGIGEGAITLLLDRFGNRESLLRASVEEIEAIKGIGEDKAWLIAGHLHHNVLYHRLWDPSEEEWVELYQVPEEIIDQCVTTRTYLTQSVRKRYRLPAREINDRGLVKERR